MGGPTLVLPDCILLLYAGEALHSILRDDAENRLIFTTGESLSANAVYVFPGDDAKDRLIFMTGESLSANAVYVFPGDGAKDRLRIFHPGFRGGCAGGAGRQKKGQGEKRQSAHQKFFHGQYLPYIDVYIIHNRP